MSAAQKDTIYIDIDDEITNIIEKVRASKEKIVALVLPKRATSLQSIVNMKLLQRAAVDNKKNIVLITSEIALLPLAGAAGVHVAKTLQSKPVIPQAPLSPAEDLKINGEDEAIEIDPQKSIGELSGDESEEESIEVDYSDDEESSGEQDSQPKKRNKKLKIPNFERFRLILVLVAVFVIALIVGGFWALMIAPKAKITIKTDTNTVNSAIDFTASPGAKTLDTTKLIVPATVIDSKKADSQKVPATGNKDVGTKASGNVDMSTPCTPKAPTVPVGTTVSSGSASFITQSDVTLSSPSVDGGGNCILSGSGKVLAQNAGDQYNLSSRAYTVSGFPGVSAFGSNMTGGVSKIIKVVSQQDVDTAKQQLLDKTKVNATNDIQQQLRDKGMYVLADTFVASVPTIGSAPNVGEEATDVTVTISITYSQTGVLVTDLKKLIEADVKQKIDPTTQVITDNDDGLSRAIVKLGVKQANGDTKVNLQTTVTAGPQLDDSAIKKDVAGKKKGDTIAIIQKRPGIKDVTVEYSPFWVFSTPHKTNRITVVFEKANGGN